MNDISPTGPRFDEPRADITRQVAPNDWNRAELEAPVEPPPRERLFPRKVLIGWALFAVALYFGVSVVRSVIKETVREAITTAAEQSGTKEIIYQTPNGHITITRDKPSGTISISTDGSRKRASSATTAVPAQSVPKAEPAGAIPPPEPAAPTTKTPPAPAKR